jgi:hypothetical protein
MRLLCKNAIPVGYGKELAYLILREAETPSSNKETVTDENE